MSSIPISRRTALRAVGAAACSCLAGCALPVRERLVADRAAASGQLIAKTSFGELSRVADGVYAFVATPFAADGSAGDLRAHSNSGIILGTDGALVVDALRTPEASAWLAKTCLELLGRQPTHLVCTHFHFDHIGGILGFASGGKLPTVYQTEEMRNLARSAYGTLTQKSGSPHSHSKLQEWGGHYVEPTEVISPNAEPLTIDLGGRSVVVREFVGHTASDLIVEVPEQGVVFAGDLVWNGIFPNFMSSSPREWNRSIEDLFAGAPRILIPGHGPVGLSDEEGLKSFAELLPLIESEARAAFAKGRSAEIAGREFRVPKSLGAWRYFRPGFHETAFRRWYEVLAH